MLKLTDGHFFRVCDSETSGTDPSIHGVVEVAFVDMLDDGQALTTWSRLFNPGHAIPPTASAIHHITDEDVVGMLHWSALRDLDGYLDHNAVYVAHEASFDRSFLYPDAPLRWLCTRRLMMHLRNDLPGYGNEVIRYALKLGVDSPNGAASHRAAHDVAVTAAILKWALVQVREQWPEVTTIEQLIERIEGPCELRMVPFKKQQELGQTFRDVEVSLLDWIIIKQAGGADVIYSAERELLRRYPRKPVAAEADCLF